MAKKHFIAAGIDVGSHALRMKIAEVKSSGEINTLEMLRKSISLGRDTFATGKVSFETVADTCKILKGFKKLMNEYKVSAYKAYATSAIREALNRDYVIDQIKLKTGLDIEVKNNSEERFLTYKALGEIIPDFESLRKRGLLLLDIGSGSIQLTSYRDNSLEYTQNIELGSLRIREVLSDIEGQTINFISLLQEYIDCHLDKTEILTSDNYCNFMAMGGVIRTIVEICNNAPATSVYNELDTTRFLKVYDELEKMPLHQIAKKYRLPEDRVDILLPSMMIVRKFLRQSCSETIIAPLVSLRDGIVSEIAQDMLDKKNDLLVRDVISAARYIAEKYDYDKNHSNDVEQKSLILFDRLKTLHGLKNKHRLLLQLAAVLHDIGKFINLKNHYIHSYNIIKALDIPGLSQEELEITANIAKYHSSKVPAGRDDNFSKINEKNRVVTAKLAAIIRLADALDSSHRQKIKNISVRLNGDMLIIEAESPYDILLEEWTFNNKSDFFKEVFGITPVLKRKRKIVQ